MAGFTPKKKLSKKAQKELNRQRRTMWNFSPVTRAVDSRKVYNRKRNTRSRYDDGAGVFHASGNRLPCFCLRSRKYGNVISKAIQDEHSLLLRLWQHQIRHISDQAV